MRILISGSSGFIGKNLCSELENRGHAVFRLVRRKVVDSNTEFFWDPQNSIFEREKLPEIDAVINLAGSNISSGRWNVARKTLILNSRVQSTLLLSKIISQLNPKPAVFISASAIGYYGYNGDDTVTEKSENGNDFLAKVCNAWEMCTQQAQKSGIRVVLLRIGMVLHKDGGSMQRIIPVFKKGLGGRFGNGLQYMSWISLLDTIESILFLIENPEITGPVNLCSPDPVRNIDFTKSLASLIGKPAIVPVPAIGLKIAFGEMANNLLLTSIKAIPEKLESMKYPFKHRKLEHALKYCLH